MELDQGNQLFLHVSERKQTVNQDFHNVNKKEVDDFGYMSVQKVVVSSVKQIYR